ncbi:DUF2922 family protein [Lacticaseibacillus baoqingensis]|uniref:DUF2922 family protein n=1 Tax=Lacticaseibacillus baoqingensis TaxID=2486013 RepID=A0ABW4E4G8_9LACO|nr:DUF2922 family protein [Lacticaseibacillus baoqingensis]
MADTTTRTVRLSYFGSDGGRYNFTVSQLRNDVTVEKADAALDDLANLNAFQRGEVLLYTQALEANQVTTTTHQIVLR